MFIEDADIKLLALAACLLFALPGLAQAREQLDLCAHHCSRDDVPMHAELRQSNKDKLLRNGQPITMLAFRSYLKDAAAMIAKGDNIYIHYGDRRYPPRAEIVAAMKQQGFIRRPECPRLRTPVLP